MNRDLGRPLHLIAPVSTAAQAREIFPLALALLGPHPSARVQLLGVTQVEPGASLSDGALPVQQLRAAIADMMAERGHVRGVVDSTVSYSPWDDIERTIAERDDAADVLLVPYTADGKTAIAPADALTKPPCDAVVAKVGIPPQHIRRILLPLRGGPYASLALQCAVRLARSCHAQITLLRVLSRDDDKNSRLLRREFSGLAGLIPEVADEIQTIGDPMDLITRDLRRYQAVVLGASAIPNSPPIGRIAQYALARAKLTTLIVRTREPFQLPASSEAAPAPPVSIRVDKWFAENTFSCREFENVERLVASKRQQKLTISLALPALNEEATIANVIGAAKPLMEQAGLLDEIVVIDSDSTDATRQIAHSLGVSVHVHQDVLPSMGALRGKGEALWKSLQVTRGDIIAWIDTDIVNPHPRFILGVIGPLIAHSHIQYVKGFYQRPIVLEGKLQSSGGGRVTELLARPMLNLYFPELSGFVQPLAGEYAGRRESLERVPFYSGYGVETGLLLDLLKQHGLRGLAQVDLEERVHRNQELQALSKMSFALLQVFLDHMQGAGVMAEGVTVEPTMKLLRLDADRMRLEEVSIREHKRPPMIEVEDYWRHA